MQDIHSLVPELHILSLEPGKEPHWARGESAMRVLGEGKMNSKEATTIIVILPS